MTARAERGPGLVDLETSQTTLLAQPLTDKYDTSKEAWDVMGRRRRINQMRKGVEAAGALLAEKFGNRSNAFMVTLTYRAGLAARPKHVSQYLDALRHWAKRKRIECGYVWALELTKAGVPHYHVVVWLSHGYPPKPDKRGWWPHGMSQVKKARRPIGYLISYAKKLKESTYGEFPRGFRLFGVGGLSRAERRTKSYRQLPNYVKEAFDESDGVRRCPGGGWLNESSGEYLASVRLVYYGGRVWVIHSEEKKSVEV